MKKVNLNNFSSILSPLENDVLSILWKNEEMKVREIYSILKKRRKVALSSVAVILDRLFEKGIVGRKVETGRGGIRYVYHTKQNKNTFEMSVIENAVNRLIDKFGNTAVTYFNERFTKGKEK